MPLLVPPLHGQRSTDEWLAPHKYLGANKRTEVGAAAGGACALGAQRALEPHPRWDVAAGCARVRSGRHGPQGPGPAGGARGAGRGRTCAAGLGGRMLGGTRAPEQLRAPPRGLLPAAAAPRLLPRCAAPVSKFSSAVSVGSGEEAEGVLCQNEGRNQEEGVRCWHQGFQLVSQRNKVFQNPDTSSPQGSRCTVVILRRKSVHHLVPGRPVAIFSAAVAVGIVVSAVPRAVWCT